MLDITALRFCRLFCSTSIALICVPCMGSKRQYFSYCSADAPSFSVTYRQLISTSCHHSGSAFTNVVGIRHPCGGESRERKTSGETDERCWMGPTDELNDAIDEFGSSNQRKIGRWEQVAEWNNKNSRCDDEVSNPHHFPAWPYR